MRFLGQRFSGLISCFFFLFLIAQFWSPSNAILFQLADCSAAVRSTGNFFVFQRVSEIVFSLASRRNNTSLTVAAHIPNRSDAKYRNRDSTVKVQAKFNENPKQDSSWGQNCARELLLSRFANTVANILHQFAICVWVKNINHSERSKQREIERKFRKITHDSKVESA